MAAVTGLRLAPFVATRYANLDADHLAAVTSPAYDLIPPAQRTRLEDADPRNIVRLILPQPVPDLQDKYECAAEALDRWRAEGTLVTDVVPALYVYEMSEDLVAHPTVGIIGQIAVLPDSDGGVLPHEDVWDPVVVDRTALAAATEANLEAIVLAADLALQDWPDVQIARTDPPLVDFTGADGVRHRIWQIADPLAVTRVTSTVNGGVAVIADGHHRWASYQRLLATDGGSGAGQALAYLVPVSDAGLRVRAIHRVLRHRRLDSVIAGAAVGYDVVDRTEELVSDDLEESIARAQRRLLAAEPFTVLLSDGQRWVELRRPDPTAREAAVGTDHQHNWRQLDIAVTHRYLLEDLLEVKDTDPNLQPSYEPAITLAQLADEPGTGVLLMVRSSSPQQVLSVARDGDRMPRKSTLFVPKPRTGLLLRQFGDNPDSD